MKAKPMNWRIRSVDRLSLHTKQNDKFNMIKTIKNSGLRKLFESGKSTGIRQDWHTRVVMLLDLLHAASDPDKLKIQGTGFHRIKGYRSNQYAMAVNDDFLLVFEYDGEGFNAIDLKEYQ